MNGNFFGHGVPLAQFDGYTQAQIAALLGAENLIINGAMQVAQRGTSEAGVTNSGYYAVDRWKFNINVAGSWTIEQGLGLGEHAKSLKVTCTTADASLSAGDFIILSTALEGQDLQHLRKGTVDAKALSLGLIMKSDETKTFICELYDHDNGRHVCGSMTVTSSDVEQKVSFAFAGDTSGVLDNDANASLQLNIWLAAGSDFTSGTLQTSWGATVQANRAVGCDNLADAVNNYFEITGVQLVPGEILPPFRHEPYGDVLQKCQRYYQRYGDSNNASLGVFTVWASTSGYSGMTIPEMRAAPTGSMEGNLANCVLYLSSGSTRQLTSFNVNNASKNMIEMLIQWSGGVSSPDNGWLRLASIYNVLTLDAEI